MAMVSVAPLWGGVLLGSGLTAASAGKNGSACRGKKEVKTMDALRRFCGPPVAHLGVRSEMGRLAASKTLPDGKFFCLSCEQESRCRSVRRTAPIQVGDSSAERRQSHAAQSYTGRAQVLATGSTCSACKGKKAIDCPGCKGSGRNKKNGNMFERWKCYDCQGFGLVSCPSCSKGKGLTPEQRGER